MELYQALEEKEKLSCEESFFNFFKYSWAITNPTVKFVYNWHIEFYCSIIQEMLDRLLRGEKKPWDLCVNTPPKSLKSFIFSVAFPAWAWIKRPALKIISCSYSPSLAVRDCRRTRDLMASEWYQNYWSDKFYLVTDAQEFYRNNADGERRVTSPRMSATGHQADIIIVDDPNAADDRYSQADRDMVIRWYNETMWSRLDNQDLGFRVVIQQRIDGVDLTGHIMKNYPDKYVFIVLPADLSEGAKAHPRHLEQYYKDGLLFPERIGRKILDEAKATTRLSYHGQYNQNPVAIGGRLFKEHWFQFKTKEQLPAFEKIIVSVDGSFTAGVDSANTSIQAWGYARPNFYLLYDLSMKLGAIDAGKTIERVMAQFPGAVLVIENAANGYYLIELLSQKFSVYKFDPRRFGGKEVRAESIALLWQTGNVFLMDNQHNRTVYAEEILAFPNSELKDRVDAMAQALLYFTRCCPGLATPNQGGY